jgi:hypothetical protein
MSIKRVFASVMLSMALVTVGSSIALAKTKHRRVPCAVPAGAQVVAQDSLVRIIAVNGPLSSGGAQISREWRYCLRSRYHRYRTLVDAATHGYGDIVDVGPVVLSGAYVAYNTETTADAGRYGNNPIGRIDVRDLITGTDQFATLDCNLTSNQISFCAVGPTDYYCSAPFCGAGPPVLIVSSAGLAAWQAEQECIYGNDTAWRPCAWTVQVLDGRTGWQDVLDRLPPVQGAYLADPFNNLGLYNCTAGCSATNQSIAAWSDNGVWRTASVQ